jgi:hypothetical protein
MMKRNALPAALATMACLLLAACASGPARRVSEPAVNIQQLTVRVDGSWSVDLRIDNFSSVPMRFDRLSLAMRVGGQAAGTLQGQPGLTIGPEAADVSTLALSPSPAARIVIADALARGGSVEYTLDGSLDAAAENGRTRTYDVERSNALGPVPGLPGVMR